MLSGLALRSDPGILSPVANQSVEFRAPRPSPERWIVVACAATLAAIALSIHLLIAVQLDASGSFDQQDVFFHADTQSRLECAVEGKCAGRSTIAHPNLALFVNPPVGAVAMLLSGRGASKADVAEARHRASIWLSPVAAGLQAAVAFYFLLSIGLGRIPAAVATLLGVFSFSGLVFGSIPESFALSGLLITIAYWLASRPEPGAVPRWGRWFVLGLFATGITVTNLVYIAILFFIARLNAGDDWQRSAFRCLPLTAAVGAATLLLAIVSHGLYESRPLEMSEGVRYIDTWSRDNNPIERAAGFPTALANSIVAINPIPAHNYQARLHDAQYKFRFSFEGRPEVFTAARPFATTLLLFAIAGGVAMWRSEPRVRYVAAASIAIVIFNFVLHAFWGVEVFLYSQHWLQAFSLLAVGVLFLPDRFATAALLLMTTFTLAIAANNYHVGRVMLKYFAAGE